MAQSIKRKVKEEKEYHGTAKGQEPTTTTKVESVEIEIKPKCKKQEAEVQQKPKNYPPQKMSGQCKRASLRITQDGLCDDKEQSNARDPHLDEDEMREKTKKI